MKRVVVALGGNALGETPEKQKEMAVITAKNLIPIIKAGFEVVITHGNGPQVGLINLAFTEGHKHDEKISLMPFSECGAMSEGYIGYHLTNALTCEFAKENINKHVVSIVTQVEVDKDDKAFLNPTKPIGSFYTFKEAKKMPYPMKEDALRGYRRVIASPKPVKVIEEPVINTLINAGYIVIACGGGGIPVINNNGVYEGVEAVIDKDFASSKLANDINSDYLLILTAVDQVSLNYKQENEIKLSQVSLEDMIKYNELNHFYAGSMKPKVEASIEFVKQDKNHIAIITSPEKAYDALLGNSGTTIYNK